MASPSARSVLGALALLALAPPCPRAGENAGVTAVPILQTPMGARAVGMGAAFTGVADDVSALAYNPGGLSNLHSTELTAMSMSGGDDPGSVQYLAAGTPLAFSGFAGSGYATLAGSLLLSHNGDIRFNPLNPDGTAGTPSTVKAGGDAVGTIGYAERLLDTPFETPDSTKHVEHFLGFSGKIISSTLPQTKSAQAYAADLGYFGRCPELGVTLGASVLNLGSKLRFEENGDPLPLAMRLGGAWSIPMPESHSLLWAVDGQYEYYERLWFVNSGLEYTLFKTFAARVGYQAHRDMAGFTFGFGAKWGHWGIDYAWAEGSDFGNTSRVSLTFRFGEIPVREREKVRRPVIENMPEREELKEMEERQPATYDKPRTPPSRPAPAERKGAPGWIY